MYSGPEACKVRFRVRSAVCLVDVCDERVQCRGILMLSSMHTKETNLSVQIPTAPPPSPIPTPPTPRPPPPTTTPPPLPQIAQTNSFVRLVVAMPYTKVRLGQKASQRCMHHSRLYSTMHVSCPLRQAQFDQDKQLKFRRALAKSAGTTAESVEILSITEGRRRQGQGIKVENKVSIRERAR
jgi:hypothetical protein